jgi:RND family efflux transporter MFP subunit
VFLNESLVRSAIAAALLLTAAAPLGCKPAGASPTEAPPREAPATVETVKVREQPMPRSLQLTGSLRGIQQTDLAANAMGRVIATYVERGSEVKKGDKLAALDVRNAAATAAEVRASVALARAQADAAARECERYTKLFEQNVISPAERDRMNDTCRTSAISVQAAQARANTVGIALADGTIVAPFAGVITQRHVNTGEYVRTDSKVVTLMNIDSLRLEFTVPEANLAAVKEGGALSFTVPAYPDRTFTGTVRFVGGAVRETTRDLVAEAVVDNADRALRPGMFATIAGRRAPRGAGGDPGPPAGGGGLTPVQAPPILALMPRSSHAGRDR